MRASGKLQWDQLPLVQVDGCNLVQCNPTAEYLGRKFGLVPSDPLLAHLCGSVYAASQDARSVLVGMPFKRDGPPSEADFAEALAGCLGAKGMLGRYAPKWEGMLAVAADGPEGGAYFLGAKPCIGDIGVFEAVDFFRDVFGVEEFGKAFAPFPRLLAHSAAVRALGNLAAHCDEYRKCYDTWDGEAHSRWGVYSHAVKVTLGYIK